MYPKRSFTPSLSAITGSLPSKKMELRTTLFLSLPLLSLSFIAIAQPLDKDPDCVYTIYIRTGSIFKAGTDSNINVRFYDSNGYGVEITNLESWGGLMGPGYNYFERGNLDIFSGRGPCLTAPICALNLTSDGSGPHHGWYCNYVEVTTTGVHTACAQQTFTVEQWLATDTSPYELTAIRNYCTDDLERLGREIKTVHSPALTSSAV